MSEPAAIDPEYVAELERRLAATEAEIVRVTAQNTVLETANISLAEANARLERMLAQARHEKFGPRSEKGDPPLVVVRRKPLPGSGTSATCSRKT